MGEGSFEALWWFVGAMAVTFLLTVLACRRVIPILRARRVGQNILTEYVEEHAGKAGTPTMGGICFIMPFLLVVFVYTLIMALRGENLLSMALCVCFGVANAMIGFADDYTKLCHQKNEGLTSRQKFLLQSITAGVFLFAMAMLGQIDTVLELPMLGVSADLGVFYYPMAFLVIVGVVNSTNLTDGIDGLASTVALVATMGIALIGFFDGMTQFTLPCGALIGGLVGFLIFNFHPAKVFMGDTGSLFLGGLLIGLGFSMGKVLLVVLLCGVFVLDMLSSLIQIISIRVFHRKVFKIAPFHHALQKDGWKEEKIVYVFAGVGLLFAAAATVLQWLYY